jgi:CxxC motif-containing protein
MYDPRRLPVKTSVPCPKERIDELLKDIYALKVKLPVQGGTVLLANWKGTGIDVVAVRALD